MAGGSRKQITFDLRQAALKQFYPKKPLSLNPQHYKKAYRDIQRFMEKNGFEHRQYSVYTSIEKLSVADIVRLMGDLGQQFPWLYPCVNEIDVTNIGAQHSLKEVLENAAKTVAPDLEHIEVPEEIQRNEAVQPSQPVPLISGTKHKSRKKNIPER